MYNFIFDGSVLQVKKIIENYKIVNIRLHRYDKAKNEKDFILTIISKDWIIHADKKYILPMQ